MARILRGEPLAMSVMSDEGHDEMMRAKSCNHTLSQCKARPHHRPHPRTFQLDAGSESVFADLYMKAWALLRMG
jgi:hypothetical protein